jgi:tetratricopeptide (TPR) repeat protein
MTGPDPCPGNSTTPQRTLTEPTLPPRDDDASAHSSSGGLPYELLEKLGQGGMGVVYKARQPGLNRIVAIKRLLPDAGATARARFIIEAQAVARLQHPNIVQIHEIGEADGLPYFSMEYVPGTNLAATLASTPQDPRFAAQLVEVVAGAVPVDTFEKLAAGFPANSDFGENLGLFHSVVGAAEYQHGRYGSALEWFTRATTYLEPIFHDGPHTALLRTKLAEAHAGRGGSLFGLKRYAEAIAELDRAQALDADKARMQVDTLRRLAIVLIQQEMVPALSLARAGDHVKATALAMELAKGRNGHPEMDYNAACVFAICAGKIKDRDSVAATGYATQAIALLRRAQAGGLFKDAKRLGQMEKDHDLDPLRERTDFKKVIEDAKTSPGVSRP